MRRTGEEHEAFNSRLHQIVTQMETRGISASLWWSIMLSLLTGPALIACNELKHQALWTEEMLDEMCKKVLFDREMKDNGMENGTSVSFQDFRKVTGGDERATRNFV